MIHKKIVLVVGLVFAMLSSDTATLVRAIDTTETSMAPVTKLIVSAYGWEYEPAVKDISGKVVEPEKRWLSYVQLYNGSDRPVDLSQYTLSVQALDSEIMPDCAPAEKCMNIALPSAQNEGFLPAGKHILFSADDSVVGAKHHMDEFLLPDYQKSTIPWFRFVVSSSSERETDVVAKLDSRTDPDHEYADWLRNENSSGTGYNESFTAYSNAPQALFDDPLYILPSVPSIRVDEIYPYGMECDSERADVLCYDYIKIHVSENVDLSQYVLRTSSDSSSRTKGNTFWLGVYKPNEEGFVTIYLNDDGQPYSLTNSGGSVWVEDLYGLQKYPSTLARYQSASLTQRGWSWMLPDSTLLGWSITPSPGVMNKFTPYIPEKKSTICPEGKYLNPETGRCRTIEEAVNALAACPEGQERNLATNRCRKIESATGSSLVPCGEGQERNPLTNRCRSIASAVAELLPCDEGYERNPATNRCRKVLGVATGVSNKSVDTKLPAESLASSPWGWVTAGIVGVAAMGYAAYEWRSEVTGGFRKLAGKFVRSK